MVRGEREDYFPFITLPWAIYFALLALRVQTLIALSPMWDFLIHSLSADTASARQQAPYWQCNPPSSHQYSGYVKRVSPVVRNASGKRLEKVFAALTIYFNPRMRRCKLPEN